jgi:hypothetical protein
MSEVYVIKSSDWVNDFQDGLGLGRFLIVEVPLPELTNIPSTSPSNEEKILRERLEAAYKILPQLELDLKKGEWGDVVRRARELLELFKKDVTRTIKRIIDQTSTMDDESATSFTMSIDNLYGYSNGLHHSLQKDGTIRTVYTGGKEDAYMIYLLVTSMTSLLSRKFAKVFGQNV